LSKPLPQFIRGFTDPKHFQDLIYLVAAASLTGGQEEEANL
jgi:hypothetical protein